MNEKVGNGIHHMIDIQVVQMTCISIISESGMVGAWLNPFVNKALGSMNGHGKVGRVKQGFV
ncbi:hypothetical protein [Paenibacillus sp. TSA_86.1]|uniref:hypothetical protein n=1 Tax=Paenibacillus sp. TSA_86.1 TaxID=3415649 RepID=UPI00404625E0